MPNPVVRDKNGKQIFVNNKISYERREYVVTDIINTEYIRIKLGIMSQLVNPKKVKLL